MSLLSLQEYREDRDGWLAEPLTGLAHNMRSVALAADADARRAGRKSGTLENCGSSLQRVFASSIGGGELDAQAFERYASVTLESWGACNFEAYLRSIPAWSFLATSSKQTLYWAEYNLLASKLVANGPAFLQASISRFTLFCGCLLSF